MNTLQFIPKSFRHPAPVKTLRHVPMHKGKERTNNIVVDMVLDCIIQAQKLNRPLATIQLNAQYWVWFTDWVKTLLKPGEALPERWLIDDIMIEAGEPGQVDIIRQIFA